MGPRATAQASEAASQQLTVRVHPPVPVHALASAHVYPSRRHRWRRRACRRRDDSSLMSSLEGQLRDGAPQSPRPIHRHRRALCHPLAAGCCCTPCSLFPLRLLSRNRLSRNRHPIPQSVANTCRAVTLGDPSLTTGKSSNNRALTTGHPPGGRPVRLAVRRRARGAAPPTREEPRSRRITTYVVDSLPGGPGSGWSVPWDYDYDGLPCVRLCAGAGGCCPAG